MPQTSFCGILEELLSRFGKFSYEHSGKRGHFQTLVFTKVRVGFEASRLQIEIL
jgi:hypothetical protein